MKTKRLLAGILSAAIVLSAAPAALATEGSLSYFTKGNTYHQGQFTDVASSAWYTPNVAAAYNMGLMKGSSSSAFNPSGNLTIAETIAMASRLHSIYYNDGESFAASSPWYKAYTDYAEAEGMISGYSDVSYVRTATRAEFAKIFAAALPDAALPAVNNISALPDVSASASYLPSVLKLYKAGILTGNDAYGTFAPESHIDRGSAAAIVTRMADPNLRKKITLMDDSTLTIDYPYLTIRLGETQKLSASTSQGAAPITWKSNSPAVATVSASGVVTAKAIGSAEIVGTTPSGATVTCIVTCHDRYYQNTPIYDYGFITGAYCCNTYDRANDSLYNDYCPGYSGYVYTYDVQQLWDYQSALTRAGFTYDSESSVDNDVYYLEKDGIIFVVASHISAFKDNTPCVTLVFDQLYI